MKAFFSFLERALLAICAVAFGGLIVVVFLQVLARNVFQVPMIWTLDVAQLLFSWCIYLGAAVGVKWGAHFALDLFPAGMRRTNALLKLFADLALLGVASALFWGGWSFTMFGLNRTSMALGISEAYFVAPIPIAATIMVVFIAPILAADVRALLARAGEPH